MPKALTALLLTVVSAHLALADDATFPRVKVPDLKGRQTKAVLIFSDGDKAVEVRPAKGDAVSIPYAEIDKCSYEYTKKHRVASGIIIGAVSPLTGLIVFLTKSKSHWLEIDYHDQDLPHAYILRMHKRDYVHILEAVKTHVGIDAEVLGNADKRNK